MQYSMNNLWKISLVFFFLLVLALRIIHWSFILYYNNQDFPWILKNEAENNLFLMSHFWSKSQCTGTDVWAVYGCQCIKGRTKQLFSVQVFFFQLFLFKVHPLHNSINSSHNLWINIQLSCIHTDLDSNKMFTARHARLKYCRNWIDTVCYIC